MNSTLKFILIIIVLIYIFFILKSVKRKNMRISYLIFWSITGVLLIIALLIPNLVENISNLIGIKTPINMIFIIAIFLLLYLIYNLMILISKEEKRNTLLIQEISILKKKINDIENDKR